MTAEASSILVSERAIGPRWSKASTKGSISSFSTRDRGPAVTCTSRAIARFIFSGSAKRFPNVKMIWSHGGGTMPFLIDRYHALSRLPHYKDLCPDGFLPVARSFYYDTAQASHPGALLSLLNLVDVSQVVFGTDFPYRTSLDHVKGLMAMGFSMNDLTAIESRNAQRLLSLSL